MALTLFTIVLWTPFFFSSESGTHCSTTCTRSGALRKSGDIKNWEKIWKQPNNLAPGRKKCILYIPWNQKLGRKKRIRKLNLHEPQKINLLGYYLATKADDKVSWDQLGVIGKIWLVVLLIFVEVFQFFYNYRVIRIYIISIRIFLSNFSILKTIEVRI